MDNSLITCPLALFQITPAILEEDILEAPEIVVLMPRKVVCRERTQLFPDVIFMSGWRNYLVVHAQSKVIQTLAGYNLARCSDCGFRVLIEFYCKEDQTCHDTKISTKSKPVIQPVHLHD